MALVDYGYSDESDSDEQTDVNVFSEGLGPAEGNAVNGKNEGSPIAVLPEANAYNTPLEDDEGKEKELFSTLPTPKNTFSMPDNTFKLLNKKQPVRIVLPSLSDIKTDKEEVTKRRKPSTIGSGLFALLPAPKNTTSLVPNVLKNNVIPPKNLVKKPFVPMSIKTKSKSTTPFTKITDKLNEEDDDLDKPESFFFSTEDVKPEEMEPVNIPDIAGRSSSPTEVPTTSAQNHATPVEADFNEPGENYFAVNMDTNDINEEAIEKLCGAGAKKRKGAPDEIIDISVDSMIGDAYMWLTKDLTKEKEHTSFKKPKNLSVVERRKHQITYLASQAKEKELELRNQWANNRMSRKQTQSKYGF